MEGDAETLPLADVAAGAGGRRSGPGGVPVGFTRTQAGAVAAATVYTMATAGPGMYDPNVRALIMAAVGAPHWSPAARAAADAMVTRSSQDLGLSAAGQAPAGRTLLSVVRPSWGAFRVDSYSTAAASVRVWTYLERGVVNRQGESAAGSWRTATVHLRWTDGDWHLRELPQLAPGLQPAVTPGSPPSVTEVARTLNPSHAPSGGGWRLYANTGEAR